MVRLIRAAALGDRLIAVHDGDRHGLAVAELDFANGTAIWVGDCHRPTLRTLRLRLEQDAVVLGRAAHHGPCWGFYFISGQGPLPVLAGDAEVLQAGRGGGSRRSETTPEGPRQPSLAPA
ncbi:MAG: hypothetical protein ACR2KC_00450 [Acidimicrobiales bacterium]